MIHGVDPAARSNPGSATTWNRAPISWSSWRDLQQASDAFEDVGAWMPTQQIIGDDRSEFITVFYASSSFFHVLGVRPAAGRLFGADEDEDMASSAVISFEAWRRRFGGSQDVVGSTISIAHTLRSPAERKSIIGVLPPGFTFQGQRPEVILPIGLMSFNGSFEQNRFLRAVGRLSSDITLAQAVTVAEPLVRRSAEPGRRSVRLVPLVEDQFGAVTNRLWVLAATAILLLAISGSCVAGMLLADGGSRRTEIAIRVSLGATRGRLFRQLLTEYLSIALTSGLVGGLLASWLGPVLIGAGPALIRGVETAAFDARILLAGVGISVVTVVLFGIGPAISLSALPARSTMGPTRRLTSHRWIVVGQLAFTHVVAVAAAIYGGVLVQLQSKPVGFVAEGLAVARVALSRAPTIMPDDRGRITTQRTAGRSRIGSYDWLHTDRLVEALRTAPGVIHAAAVSVAPFTVDAPTTLIVDETTGAEHLVQRREITEAYFQTLGIPIIAGRTFTPRDRVVSVADPVIVSADFARRLGGPVIGRRLMWGGLPLEILGVVAEARQQPRHDDLPAFYLLNSRVEHIGYFVARTSSDAASFLPTMNEVLERQDPFLDVTLTATMSTLMAESRADERFSAFMSVAFAVAALGLAGVGVFALTAYILKCRYRDTAVRIALGASAGDIRRLFSRELALIVALGTTLGLPLGYVASLVVRSSTVGAAASMWLFLGVVAVLWLAAAAAAAVPLRQAARIDVLRVLKE